jgi:hypothetical protein
MMRSGFQVSALPHASQHDIRAVNPDHRRERGAGHATLPILPNGVCLRPSPLEARP